MLAYGSVWLDLAADVGFLCLEAQVVVGLRVSRAACGDVDFQDEAWLMIVEKGRAALEAQALFSGSLLAGEGHLGAVRAVELYRRRVQANRLRLSSIGQRRAVTDA